MKTRASYPFAGKDRAETAMYASLGLMAALSIVFASLTMSDFVQGRDKVIQEFTYGLPTQTHSFSGVRYISSGQLLADVRTLTAMARFMLEPDGQARTNFDVNPAGAATPASSNHAREVRNPNA